MEKTEIDFQEERVTLTLEHIIRNSTQKEKEKDRWGRADRGSRPAQITVIL